MRIDLNEPKILAKVTNDRFGKFVSKSWKDLIDPYTPEDTGLLMGRIGMSVDTNVPFQIHYKATQASNSDITALRGKINDLMARCDILEQLRNENEEKTIANTSKIDKKSKGGNE